MSWPPFVCMHEATHAVIAASQALTVKRVTVEKTRGRMGFCEVARPQGWVMSELGSYVPPDIDNSDDRWQAVAMMRTALAGLMTHTAHPIAPDDQDLRQLTALLHELDLLDESREQLYLERLVLQTVDMAERHREAIDAVATELSWRKGIDGERLQAIMTEHPPLRRPRRAWPKPRIEWAGMFAEIARQYTEPQHSRLASL